MATSTLMRSLVARRIGSFSHLSFNAPLQKTLVTSRFASSYFTPAHEYVQVDGKVGTIGITDFAQSALGDIVFVDLPDVGDEFEKGESFGSVESVKAASDVYCPVGGTVVEINEALSDEPGIVNTKAESDAWFIKIEIEDDGELGELMEPDAYKEHCEKEAH
uniref:Glycine cleavage system H protein n=1 Tax=Proboscia inermis TaxID=420281 RepID=A0A7S0C7W5_9STRA|mmetsp:Transcript_39091/g.45578  ORF Transcript_39091/g.45578 Transcript_39091/m.45578 type:complete len:162 (+) Transcript_39091:91-576(+)|eukprot:CAMPEP_0171311230 /NCGR_PEP_ID=MMETSP0816-20121228/21470_1 /TAXON_ID=420281 /ORGANISM="Proboscia inermis, Strain CCAP1064/1" /LENGTH=161 /DNA_ID=CAMNT_0011795881 /DNA_START=55 /DNA_END=540 /DNA_ORIENTATION=-